MIIRFNHVAATTAVVVVTSVLLSLSSAVHAFSYSVVVVVPSAAIATRRIPTRQAGRRITSINQFYDANGSPDDVKNEKYQRQMGGQQQPPQQPPQFQPQAQQQMYVKDEYGNLVPYNPPPPPIQSQYTPPITTEGGYAPSLEFLDAMPLPPKTKQNEDMITGGRPVGYNPDAFSISNTADLYFAQLKQDSKVRKLARMRGDTDTANRVFEDETVRRIGDSWRPNPYTQEQNLAEARAEIEGAVRMQSDTGGYYANGSGGDMSSSMNGGGAVSYRDKLAQKMKGGRGGGERMIERQSNNGNDMTRSVAMTPTLQPPSIVGTTTPPPVVVAATPPVSFVGGTTTTTTNAPHSAATVTENEDDARRKLRTLQGLLLKHRGGPGFGAGRLKEMEARKLVETLGEVTDMLRGEWEENQPTTGVSRSDGGSRVSTPTMPVLSSIPPPLAPPPQTMVSPPQPITTMNDPLAGALACVEAVIKLYKEAASDPVKHDAMVTILKNALQSASESIEAVVGKKTIRLL